QVFQPVDQATFGLDRLEDIAGNIGSGQFQGRTDKVIICRWRLDTGLVEQVPAVEQAGAVVVPGDSIQLTIVRRAIDSAAEELAPFLLGEKVIHGQGPAGGCEFRYKRDIHRDDIDGGIL